MATCALGSTVTATRPVMDEAANAPSCVACAVTVMVAVPGPTAVTRPALDTVAMVGAVVP